ncbi:MAG TPA: zinc-dependent metalloprotease, partial [bacterium]|nr:zinc-dependent metalloprotease [bacterium]
DGEPFAPLRDGVTEMFAERATLLVNVDKVIGGATVSRVHKGGGVPVVPVPPERQRAALALVLEQGFSERAFHVPAELLARTPPRRGHSIANNEQNLVPVDLPIHALVLAQQRTVLDDLLSPIRLRRIVDNQARSAPGARALTVSELTSTLTAGLFSELDASRPTVGTFRRNAQRLYVDALIALLWSAETKMPPLDNLMKYGDETSIPVPPPPEDARAAARHELGTIAERASKRAPNAADADTRAHLEEIASRITHALNTTFVIPAAAPPPAGH